MILLWTVYISIYNTIHNSIYNTTLLILASKVIENQVYSTADDQGEGEHLK